MVVLQDIAASSSANTRISCQHARIFWLPPDAIGYPNVNFSWSTIASRQRVFQTWGIFLPSSCAPLSLLFRVPALLLLLHVPDALHRRFITRLLRLLCTRRGLL